MCLISTALGAVQFATECAVHRHVDATTAETFRCNSFLAIFVKTNGSMDAVLAAVREGARAMLVHVSNYLQAAVPRHRDFAARATPRLTTTTESLCRSQRNRQTCQSLQ